MKKIGSVFNRELYSFFASPIAYVVLTIYLVLTGYFFCLLLFYSESDNVMTYLFGNMMLIFMLICPLLTMRVFSEEVALGTFELIITSPIRLTDWIIGKFFAVLFLYSMMLALTFPYVVILKWIGNPALRPIFSGYLGVFLAGAAFIAVGVFASSLSRSQMIAAFVGFGFTLLLWIIGWSATLASGAFFNFIQLLSFLDHFHNFEKGLISSADIIYYLSFIVLFLFLTHQRFQLRRQ